MNTDIEPSIIDRVRASISMLEGGLAQNEDVLTAIGFMARLKELTRELSAQIEAGAIAYINEHGDLDAGGGVRYYVAANKSTKCIKPQETIEALLTATQGDEAAMVECLASDAFKPGACRKLLPPEVFAALFETKETPDLKTGKSEPKLQKFDEKYTDRR